MGDRAQRAQLSSSWKTFFAASPEIAAVWARFDEAGRQGRIYVGLQATGDSDGLWHLSDLTESYEVSLPERRVRFAFFHAVFDQLRAHPPLEFAPLLVERRKVTEVCMTPTGLGMWTGLSTNHWPPTDHETLFLPWSAPYYPIDDAQLAEVGLPPHPELEQWPPREVHGLW